jgi:hypothetical protein
VPVETELVDAVPYADPSDVAVYIRNKEFGASSDPTAKQVRELLLRASDRVDRSTGRAWRTRRAVGLERQVQRSHDQRRTVLRGGRGRRGARGARTGQSRAGMAGYRFGSHRRRGMVFLDHIDLRPIDAGAGDEVIVLRENGTEDVTGNEGRGLGDGADYVLDERAGVLAVDLDVFGTGGSATRTRAGRRGTSVLDPAQVRVSYRYGTDESAQVATDTNPAQPSASVPGELRNACAKFVAADLIHTDQYGSMLASGPESTPDQTTAAGKLFAAARDATQAYRRRPSL